MNTERLKLVQRLVRLNSETKEATRRELRDIKEQTIYCLRALGVTISGEIVIHSNEELVRLWKETDGSRRVVDAGIEYLGKLCHGSLRIMSRKRTMIYQANGRGWTKWTHDDLTMGPFQFTTKYIYSSEVVGDFVAAIQQPDVYSISNVKPIRGDYPTTIDFGGGNGVHMATMRDVPDSPKSLDELADYAEKFWKEIRYLATKDIARITKPFVDGVLKIGYGAFIAACEDPNENLKTPFLGWQCESQDKNGVSLWSRYRQDGEVFDGKCRSDSPEFQKAMYWFWRGRYFGSLEKWTDAPVKESEEWQKDRETLQSIIDGKHPDMRSPSLYSAFEAVEGRQKDNPKYPEVREKALDAWWRVVHDMTANIVD